MKALGNRLLILLSAVALASVGYYPLAGQDRVLMEAEKIRVELYAQERGMVQGRAASRESMVAIRAKLDSLFAAQERKIPSAEYQRRPSVKAPEGALELLRHERHAIIDYFIGPEMVHAFVITRKETHYRVVPHPPDFASRLADLKCQVSSPGSSASSFQQLSFGVYQQLVAPLEDLIKEMDQLTVIPDPVFRFLPFEALVRTELPSPDFRSLHYLLRDFGIGYAPSVAHLAEIQEMSPARGQGMALFASGNHAGPEMSGIRAYWAAQPETGAFHTASQMAEQGAAAEIIHLALAPENSWSAGAIAGMGLDLSLFSCSGLETSICRTLPDSMPEGLKWLHALEGAGVRSEILPAWKADPDTDAELWAEIYRGLADRQYVDQALRFAKMNYLKKAPDSRTHPYYWAGLLQFDDFSPVREGRHFPWYALLALGFLLIVLLGKRL